MGQIDPTNPAIRAVTGMLRDRRIDYNLTGGKTHKLDFVMNGKPRRISIGCGSAGMDMKIKIVTRELERIFAQVDQEVAEAKAQAAAQSQPQRRTRATPTIPAQYRTIKHGAEGEGVLFWLTADAPPGLDELLDKDGQTVVCTGLGSPFKPTAPLLAKEPSIPKDWVTGKLECVAVAYRRVTPEEQSVVDDWLDEATNPTLVAA